MGRKLKAHASSQVVSGFSERLKSLQGFENQTAFARRLGMSQAGLHHLLNGGEPGLSTLIEISKTTGASLLWLATGAAPAEADEASAGEEVRLPKLAFRASAGNGSYVVYEHEGTYAFPASVLRRLDLPPEHARVLEAAGDSMAPTIRDGDLMLIDLRRTEPVDNQVFVFSAGEEIYVRRWRKVPGTGWTIVSDNPDIPPVPLPRDAPVRIYGRVRWTERAL